MDPVPPKSSHLNIISINNSDHASAVIRALRSRSHAQKNYQNNACEDKIELKTFNDMVTSEAAHVSVSEHIDNCIRAPVAPVVISPVRSNAAVVSKTHFRDADIDFSSDEDDTPPPTTFTHEQIPQGYDSCSDLDSDEEDKAALFDGFVAPTINRKPTSTSTASATMKSNAPSPSLRSTVDDASISAMTTMTDTTQRSMSSHDTTKKHQIIMKPGQRIRVRPSRKVSQK